MKSLLMPLFTCVLFLSTTLIGVTQAQSTDEDIPTVNIKKMTPSGEDPTFTVVNAVELVRFFMAQEGVLECESNLAENTFKLVAQKGVEIQSILSAPKLQKDIIALGYKLEFDKHTTPTLATEGHKIDHSKHENSATTDPDDCGDCGDVELDDSLKESVIGNANYGGREIKINFSNNSTGKSPSSSKYSKAELDSIRNALFNKKPEE